jgi:hypothetical protein
MNARVRRREPNVDFVPPESTRDRPMGMDGRRLPDRVTAQSHDEVWCAERVVREQADGPYSVSGRFRVVNSNIS